MTERNGGLMDDLISRQALCEYALNQKDKSITPNDIMRFPSAQPDSKETSSTHKALDTISRQAAIDAILAVTGNSSVRELYEHVQEHGLSDMWSGGVSAAIDIIIAVPSAQPTEASCWGCNCPKMERLKEQKTFSEMVHLHDAETHEERMETHSCDCIERQAAIDALDEIRHALWEIDRPSPTAPEYVELHEQVQSVWELLDKKQKELYVLPSAQPEKRTENTRKTHACDLISRQAVIEINRSYHGQMPNEVNHRIWKEINELPSAQPDMSEYSDKLWRNAYERGRTEAQQRWIPCSERLPEENGQYLITVKYVHVDGYDDIYAEHGEWTDGKWDMFCFGHCGKVENIIAWMPLPEPYREEGD